MTTDPNIIAANIANREQQRQAKENATKARRDHREMMAAEYEAKKAARKAEKARKAQPPPPPPTARLADELAAIGPAAFYADGPLVLVAFSWGDKFWRSTTKERYSSKIIPELQERAAKGEPKAKLLAWFKGCCPPVRRPEGVTVPSSIFVPPKAPAAAPAASVASAPAASEWADAAAKLIAEQLCAMGSHKHVDGRCVRCGAWERP